MAEDFCYIFGAGASAQSLPIVSNFNAEVNLLLTILKDPSLLKDIRDECIRPEMTHLPLSYSEAKEQLHVFVVHVTMLLRESRKHYSIDTLARKLYLNQNINRLEFLKAIISCLFILLQALKMLDKRYDLFFSALMQGRGLSQMLPNNLKLFSWNYDNQVELCLSSLFNDYRANNIDKKIQLIPRSYPPEISVNLKRFTIVKLNGSASLEILGSDFIQRISPDYSPFTPPILKNSFVNLVIYILVYYRGYISNDDTHRPLINFAWEDNPMSKKIRSISKEIAEKIRILTVIGYSFPTFNREVDRDIIQSMKSLEKVYIQSPERDINAIIERFRAIRVSVPVEKIVGVDEFFIPYEY